VKLAGCGCRRAAQGVDVVNAGPVFLVLLGLIDYPQVTFVRGLMKVLESLNLVSITTRDFLFYHWLFNKAFSSLYCRRLLLLKFRAILQFFQHFRFF
jgi:hypothetical protein